MGWHVIKPVHHRPYIGPFVRYTAIFANKKDPDQHNDSMHVSYAYCDLGPVVQSIISLMGLLVDKMLTVLVTTISN